MIEVSDLKGKDASGTSDPTVYASCLGTTKHSRVRKGVNSAVFDEVLYFNLPALTRCEYIGAARDALELSTYCNRICDTMPWVGEGTVDCSHDAGTERVHEIRETCSTVSLQLP